MNLGTNQGNKVIFLFGPTAVGKTRLLFDFFSGTGEVVNADSVQVYRHLDIGSAKADASITEKIPHHLIDILDPWETWNVADFIRLADNACREIWGRGRIPVVSGGTAFYFKHFMYGLSDAPQSDPDTRKAVELYIRDQGLDKAYEYLQIIDPISAGRINRNDSYRISRAIEVYRSCGRSLSDFALPTTVRNGMDILSIGLLRDREELKDRIRTRVDIMFSQGIVAEIRKLLEMGASKAWQSMQGIGYSEFLEKAQTVEALEALTQADLEEIKERIISDSIHYAKRQMTFFRSFADVRWITPEDTETLSETIGSFLDQR